MEKYEKKYAIKESIISRKEREMLKGLIDSFGLGYVVGELAEITLDKSLEVEDERLALELKKDSETLERVAEKMLIN